MLSQSQSSLQQQPKLSEKTQHRLMPLPEQSHPEFPWGQRWLKGHQYGLMLQQMNDYCQKFGLASYPLNQHPLQIYDNPQNGMIYFMQAKSLKQFGFPRIHQRKIYRWKKMNFTTDLPKHNPIVTYLVASSATNNTHIPSLNNEFRMHIAALPHSNTTHILCHIRKVSSEVIDAEITSKRDLSLGQCIGSGGIDFYRLLSFLHNNHWIQK